MKFGYIRVSRDKQTTALQEDAMKVEQCTRVFTDKMSGKRFDRPEFLKMLEMARTGDVIVVWRLDRLGRSLKHLIETVTMLGERGIELRSLKEKSKASWMCFGFLPKSPATEQLYLSSTTPICP